MSNSVHRALRVLNELAEAPKTAEQLATSLGVHRTTALRILQVLESEGFVARNDQHVYRLGARVLSLGQQALEGIDLRDAASDAMRHLNEVTGHTIHLAVLEGAHVVYVDKREAADSVRMQSRIGQVAAIHCTAVGKAIVANLPPVQQTKVIAALDFEAKTDRTLSDVDSFRRELERTRERGYAVDDRENEQFVNCIGVPIIGAGGVVHGAMSISVTTVIRDLDALLDFVPDLIAVGSEVSRALGWEPSTQEDEPARR
ncbi:MAG: IclR family transcriptional regulator [Actinomycetota bacterium]